MLLIIEAFAGAAQHLRHALEVSRKEARELTESLGVMEFPCLLIPFDDDEFDYECILDYREKVFNDCDEGVGVKGLELTDKQVEKVKEHGTLLLPDNHYFVEDEILVIDGQPEFKYYPKPGGASGEKKAVMIRVTAEDDVMSHLIL